MEQGRVAEIDSRLATRADIQRRLDHNPATPGEYHLLEFDLDNKQGHVVLARGNPDTAANVATYVRGTGTDLDDVGIDFGRSDEMFDAANRAGSPSTAVITWLGYDAPPDPARRAVPALGRRRVRIAAAVPGRAGTDPQPGHRPAQHRDRPQLRHHRRRPRRGPHAERVAPGAGQSRRLRTWVTLCGAASAGSLGGGLPVLCRCAEVFLVYQPVWVCRTRRGPRDRRRPSRASLTAHAPASPRP
jgi:hypothetical protein